MSYFIQFDFLVDFIAFDILAPHESCREGIPCDKCRQLNGTCGDEHDDECCFDKPDTERKFMIRFLVKKLETCLLTNNRGQNLFINPTKRGFEFKWNNKFGNKYLYQIQISVYHYCEQMSFGP